MNMVKGADVRGLHILITGAAGFIGFHLAQKLLLAGAQITGIDNLNDYYDVALKQARLAQLEDQPQFSFQRIDLADRSAMETLFKTQSFDCVVNLAAQAGVRYSLHNPHAYIESNITGFLNILEGCRFQSVKHLVYASSSSVYGTNTSMPFSTHDNVDHPCSLYAASKKSNELMAHSYSHLYQLPTTGLRFFTVYGPWGRPDMSPILFARAIMQGQAIDVFNNGLHKRDFTYIDDIVEAITRVITLIPQSDDQWDSARADPATSSAPWRLYNIGNNTPVSLMDYIALIEKNLGKKAIRNYLPMQAGDVVETYADIDDLIADFDCKPQVSIEQGMARFIAWCRQYYA